jgi:hypothetical protein
MRDENKNLSLRKDKKRILRETAGTIPGCCDPKQPFKPISPNKCDTCQNHADYTCHNLLNKNSDFNASSK